MTKRAASDCQSTWHTNRLRVIEEQADRNSRGSQLSTSFSVSGRDMPLALLDLAGTLHSSEELAGAGGVGSSDDVSSGDLQGHYYFGEELSQKLNLER